MHEPSDARVACARLPLAQPRLSDQPHGDHRQPSALGWTLPPGAPVCVMSVTTEVAAAGAEDIARLASPTRTAQDPTSQSTAANGDYSPETYVLADAIAATPPQRRLLGVLGIRRNGAGSLPALRTATRAAAAAARRHSSRRAASWLAILRTLLERVEAAAAQAPWLNMRSTSVGHRTVCDVLADPAPCALPVEARERLDAWLGLHIFLALTRGGVVSVSALDDWETLRRTGAPRASTPTPWIAAAKCIPLDVAEVNQQLPTIRNERLKEALRLTLVALAADIPDPEALTESGEFGAPPRPPAQTDASPGYEESDDADDTDDEDEENEDALTGESLQNGESDRSPGSLMSLLIRRGTHAGYRGHFGVTLIYGELPPPNLRRTCLSLAATLQTGTHADRTRSAVAEVSLKVALSPRRTLTVSLTRNDDLWLDLQDQSIYWNFDRVLSTRECDPEGADVLGRCKPVRIRLSDACALRLTELRSANPAAGSLRDLAGAGRGRCEIDAWLEAYGHFLRGHGDDNYRAYSVRFARSYRSVYLERGHGAVAAAMLGMDFATVPGGLLHYISLSADRLTEWQLDVDRYLGLVWSPDAPAAGAN